MSSYYYQQRSTHSFAPRNRITYAVQRLILANIVVFAVQLIANIVPLGSPGMPLGGLAAGWLAFRPDLFWGGCLWQPFTYMFLHEDLWHLFFNMLMLFVFGPEVERILSTRQFFRFYMLCGALGVLAGVIPWLLNKHALPVFVVGASGAILGVLAAFAVAFPEREFFLFPLPFPVNARAIVLVVIVLSLVDAVRVSNVSVSTHLGGLAVGFLYMKLAPRARTWAEAFWRKRPRAKGGQDSVGEAVDNIFKFEDEKRRRK